MTFSELVARGLARSSPGVPQWTLGCFRRRSITFFDGTTDGETEVYWLQSRGLTFDLRLSPRPRKPLRECNAAERAALAEMEGGLCDTRWDGRQMSWSNWTAFQTRDKWPEPGLLRRVGDCLIEHAPSGAYVEDWRLQPSAPGPLVGLRSPGGGLVVCGDHAGLVRGRPRPAAPDEDAFFDFEASYGVRRGEDFLVVASTNPSRPGQVLFPRDGRELDGARVVQGGRVFAVDTLEPGHDFNPATPATDEARAWLTREAATLKARARPLD